jgi:hypothetical protein
VHFVWLGTQNLGTPSLGALRFSAGHSTAVDEPSASDLNNHANFSIAYSDCLLKADSHLVSILGSYIERPFLSQPSKEASESQLTTTSIHRLLQSRNHGYLTRHSSQEVRLRCQESILPQEEV